MMEGQGQGQLPLATMAWALLLLMAKDIEALRCHPEGGSRRLLSAIVHVAESPAATPLSLRPPLLQLFWGSTVSGQHAIQADAAGHRRPQVAEQDLAAAPGQL